MKPAPSARRVSLSVTIWLALTHPRSFLTIATACSGCKVTVCRPIDSNLPEIALRLCSYSMAQAKLKNIAILGLFDQEVLWHGYNRFDFYGPNFLFLIDSTSPISLIISSFAKIVVDASI